MRSSDFTFKKNISIRLHLVSGLAGLGVIWQLYRNYCLYSSINNDVTADIVHHADVISILLQQMRSSSAHSDSPSLQSIVYII